MITAVQSPGGPCMISIFNINYQNVSVTKLFCKKACRGVVGLFECQKFQGPQSYHDMQSLRTYLEAYANIFIG